MKSKRLFPSRPRRSSNNLSRYRLPANKPLTALAKPLDSLRLATRGRVTPRWKIIPTASSMCRVRGDQRCDPPARPIAGRFLRTDESRIRKATSVRDTDEKRATRGRQGGNATLREKINSVNESREEGCGGREVLPVLNFLFRQRLRNFIVPAGPVN